MNYVNEIVKDKVFERSSKKIIWQRSCLPIKFLQKVILNETLRKDQIRFA